MKRCIWFFALASLFFGAAPARAQGINLSWNDCPGGDSGAPIARFACDTNMGTHTLVGSFEAGTYYGIPPIQMMSANEFVIQIQTTGANLPAWWGLYSGGCRAGFLDANGDFTGGPFTCFDFWQGGAVAGVQMYPTSGGGAQIRGVVALPAGDPRIRAVPEGEEFYSFKILISNAKTAGLGSCPGCDAEACIVLKSLQIDQPPPLPSPILTMWLISGFVTWQNWRQDCPPLTPAKQQTWGSIKALYR